MNESQSMASSPRRVWLPLLVSAALVLATVLIAGSNLIRIEDVTMNRILAGTYGTPDWRVLEMNPLLAQLLALLYNMAGGVNWYGGLLLAMLAGGAAAWISLAARRRGGLIPAIIVAAPILVLLTNSMISTAVVAVCASAGALSMLDGLNRRKAGIGRAVVGILLFALAAMLSLELALIVGAAVLVCWLPGMVREARTRGLLVGVSVIVVIALALFGYSALTMGTPELAAYRADNAVYERLQHSSLAEEYERLLALYGTSTLSAEHAGHDHDGDGIADGEAHDHEDDAFIEDNVFTKVGWSVNDASLFFTRYSADAQLTDPAVLRELEKEASFWNFSPSRLAEELFATVKKPQFLLLIGLFVVSALGVLITSRRRGLVALLAAVIAFGGHIAMLAHYYDTFAAIAPFYLAAIAIMLYAFNGEDAKAWLHRAFAAPWLRVGLCSLALVVFVAGMGGLLYYTRGTDVYGGMFTKMVIDMLKPYIAEHPEMLFIGENPNERLKPGTLEAPVRGENTSLLAGSYDLYSPRAAALKERFAIENPLIESIGREDVGYVLVGFYEPIIVRLAEGYGKFATEPVMLWGQTEGEYPLAEMVIQIQVYTDEEYAALIAEQEEFDAMYAELMEVIEQVLAEQAAEAEAAQGEEPVPDASATPDAGVTPDASATSGA